MASLVIISVGLGVYGYKLHKDRKEAKEAQRLEDETVAAIRARNARASNDDASSTYSGETLANEKNEMGVYEMPPVAQESRSARLSAKIRGLGERSRSRRRDSETGQKLSA